MPMQAHRIFAPALAALVLTLVVVGCSDDPATSGSGGAGGAAGVGQAGTQSGAGTQPQAGTPSAGTPAVAGAGGVGAAGTAGAAPGGSAGSGTGGSEPACGPTSEGYESSAACMGSGLPVFPLGYTLTTPMTPGQTYAIVYGVNGSEMPTVEIWGTSSQCGDKVELLSSEKRAEGTYCVEVHPTAAHAFVYSSVSVAASGARLLSFCANGSCQ